MVNRVHLFEHLGLEVFLAALDADSGRTVTYNHQVSDSVGARRRRAAQNAAAVTAQFAVAQVVYMEIANVGCVRHS